MEKGRASGADRIENERKIPIKCQQKQAHFFTTLLSALYEVNNKMVLETN